MRNSFLTLLLVMATLVQGSAQVSAGRVFIGGSLGYGMSATPDRTDNNFSSSYSISPSVGFLLNDRLALGVVAGYRYDFREYNSFNYGRTTEETRAYSIGSFLTWFVPISEDKFWFTIEGGVGYSRDFRESSVPITPNYFDSEYYSVGVGIRPGLLFFPSSKWGITLSMGDLLYMHRHGIGNDISENDIQVGLGQFSLGVLYFFK